MLDLTHVDAGHAQSGQGIGDARCVPNLGRDADRLLVRGAGRLEVAAQPMQLTDVVVNHADAAQVADALEDGASRLELGEALVPTPHPAISHRQVEPDVSNALQVLESLEHHAAPLKELDGFTWIAAVQRHIAELLQAFGHQLFLVEGCADVDSDAERVPRGGVIAGAPAELTDLQADLTGFSDLFVRQHGQCLRKHRRGFRVRALDAQRRAHFPF